MEKIKVANKYQKSIDLLNDALGKEIATSLQYMYFHTHFEDDRYQYLSKIMREISIAEMRNIEEFSDRILFLQGDVDMNASFRTRQVTDVKEMLRMAMERLNLSARAYNRILKVARTIADLEASERVLPQHLAEAISYRNLDRSDWAERGGA